jgi:acyl carrier protein/NAD(P)-dependent dehydrogenase (short-subunit alcohol dehydrogenase family)
MSAPAPASTSDDVKGRVLMLVAEKTGYPVDMLDLDLDLEADLGVDTVKQAEVFATIREAYNIPRDENRKLRDYPTLAHVIRFVYEKRPDLADAARVPTQAKVETPSSNASVPIPAAEPVRVTTSDDAVKEAVLALVVEKTGYPRDMLDLDLDLEADLGVDTVKQAEMFAAIREMYHIPRDENRKLRDYPTLAHVIRFVYEMRPDLRSAGPLTESEPAKAESMAAQKQNAEATASVSESLHGANNIDGSVEESVLALVVEKTGYPKEMLDLDLDLEADLGVDTVKQAEMFAAIRAMYGIPRDETRKLRDYPTLAHVIRFIYEKRPDLAALVPSVPVVASELESVRSDTCENETVAAPEFSGNAVKEKVLEIVAEKTGYPKDMLDPDLDLEADLGIDTVKQAEMFAAIRATYNIPRDENVKLRDFPTLGHVIRFAQERSAIKHSSAQSTAPSAKPAEGVAPARLRSELTGEDARPSIQSQAVIPSKRPRPIAASLDAANSIPRRVPIPVLRPSLSACKPSGVSFGGVHNVVIMPDVGGVADALQRLLQAKGVNVLRIDPTLAADALTNCLNQWKSSGSITGVYWLPALDPERDLGKMDSAQWHEAMRLRLKSLFVAMRTLYDDISKPGTFFVSATRLGGQHGYDDAGALAPLGGAVTGFTKTYKRERPDSFVKAVDFGLECNAAETARLLLDETLRDPGTVEIGYKDGLRWTIGLTELPPIDGQPGLSLDENTTFVVTGAAGSIVSAITADLATASGGTFYLLDLVPEPDPTNPDLKRFATDKEGLKRELFTRIQKRGERATPALVEKELVALERAQAALAAIEAVRSAGGTPYYFSVNLTDAESVKKIVDLIRQRSGRVDVLLHAAGLERSRPLADKDSRESDLVFDVKADGFFNLLHSIGDMPLGATVAFSSIAGRFGNPGQTDYSSANDLLCKITSSFRTTRRSTRGIAIDWTAWGGIGMATRGSIPKVMEQAGIDMLPPEAGVPLIRRELTAGSTRGEVVIGQRLGVLLKEWDETGGVDPSASDPAIDSSPSFGPMAGTIKNAGLYRGIMSETKLEPTRQPFLHDHKIDGTPVLPGVMGVEAFAESALSLLPGWRVKEIENVDFLAPFKFYRDEPRIVSVETTIRPAGDDLIVDCRLIGQRTLPNHSEPQSTTHFTGRVRLTKSLVQLGSGIRPGLPTGFSIEAAEIYRVYFHGPAYQVLEKAWWDGNRMIGLLADNLPSNHVPPELPTQMSPRWIELCFQTSGLWEMGAKQRMGLPRHIDRVSVGSVSEHNGRLYAVVTPNPAKNTFDAEVVDAVGNRFVYLSGYQTVAAPIPVNAEQVKVLRALLSPSPVAA